MDTALVQEPPAQLGGVGHVSTEPRPRCGPQDQGHRGLTRALPGPSCLSGNP